MLPPPNRTMVRGSPRTPAADSGVPAELAVTRGGMFIPCVHQSRYSADTQTRPSGPHGPLGPQGPQPVLHAGAHPGAAHDPFCGIMPGSGEDGTGVTGVTGVEV